MEGLDDREWTDKHMEAAGRLPKPSIACSHSTSPDDLFESNNVDARGPGGYTPLMVASFCGAGIRRSLPDSDSTGSTDIDVEEGSAAIISELINQGAAINAKTSIGRVITFLLYILQSFCGAGIRRSLPDSFTAPVRRISSGRRVGRHHFRTDQSGSTPLYALRIGRVITCFLAYSQKIQLPSTPQIRSSYKFQNLQITFLFWFYSRNGTHHLSTAHPFYKNT